MTDASPGSTVPRRQLGRHLRDARGRARLTVKAAATALEWSEAKIWRIETGQTALRSLDVEAMCRVYGTPAELTEALMDLAKETKSKGWWYAYGDVINPAFDVYLGLEEAAAEIHQHHSLVVPGLFQTADYARTLIASRQPQIAADEIDRRVSVRIARQTLLTRTTARPLLTVVLDEAVLRRPIGGRRTMAEQCARLADIGDLPNVSLQIVPFSSGLHRGVLTGSFVILRFPADSNGKEVEPPVICVDSFTGALFLEKPHEIERYDWAFSQIRSAARDTASSKEMIRAAIRELYR